LTKVNIDPYAFVSAAPIVVFLELCRRSTSTKMSGSPAAGVGRTGFPARFRSSVTAAESRGLFSVTSGIVSPTADDLPATMLNA